MDTIAIVGVTGTIGSRVAEKLVGAGHDVVGLARSPDAGPGGVRGVAVDLRDPGAATRALEGAGAVYLTPPMAGETPLDLQRDVTRNVIRAARAAGVGHIVMHTALHADRGATGSRILDEKRPLEDALADSGVPYTLLRPAWFVQNLFGAKGNLEQGVFSMPWPADMVWGATDVEDLARAAVAFLERGPANRAFDIHVPGGVTGSAICHEVERVTGRPVRYVEAESTRASVEPYPITDVHKELYAELFDYFRSTEYLGDPEAVTGALGGFAYGTLEDFLHRELFATAEV